MTKIAGFPESRLGVFCCGHVFRHERPVRLVDHDEGDWQFLCGEADHEVPTHPHPDLHLVCVGALAGHDSTLNDLADLPRGWEAERRDAASPWIRTRFEARDA